MPPNQPEAFYLRKLSDAQTRYTDILELLSIVKTLQEIRSILLGHPINIYTDHKILTFNNYMMDHVYHWRLVVEEYSPKIYYFKEYTTSSPTCYPEFLDKMHPYQR